MHQAYGLAFHLKVGVLPQVEVERSRILFTRERCRVRLTSDSAQPPLYCTQSTGLLWSRKSRVEKQSSPFTGEASLSLSLIVKNIG